MKGVPMKRFALFTVLLAFLFFGGAVSISRGEESANPDPALLRSEDWTMVIIPDPQAYSRYARNQGIFELVTAWIAENLLCFGCSGCGHCRRASCAHCDLFNFFA